MPGKISSPATGLACKPVNIGSRLELFVDDHLIDTMDGATLRLHEPREMPGNQSPRGFYMTIILDEGRYRAYYRARRPDYTGSGGDGNPGEITCCEESADGLTWVRPELGIVEINGSRANNAVLSEPPFCHSFSPFLDTRPGVDKNERFKAFAGIYRGMPANGYKPGIHTFVSADGIRWHRTGDQPVIPHNPDWHGANAFDSQNVAFWSEVEERYVAYFRHMKTPEGVSRTISRATSKDFVHWQDASATFKTPNFPGEELYTSQTHPYFRAPHIYIALPTRFTHGMQAGQAVAHADERWGRGNIGSTDIMLMSTRAGSDSFQRTFKEAFIRPGLNPERWGNRANYVALNVVPTGKGEMSIYHRSGTRYALRTDGFASLHAAWDGGRLTTKPLVFEGAKLILNFSTSIRGEIRVGLQDADGRPLPGFSLDDALPLTGDSIEQVVSWRKGSALGTHAGKPVRLTFALIDGDLYSFRFQ